MRLQNSRPSAVGLALVAALALEPITFADAASMHGAPLRTPTVTVSNISQLSTAFQAATCGTVIGLTPGDYSGWGGGDSKVLTAACPLIVTSTSPTSWARLHAFNMAHTQGVVFEALEFVAGTGETSSWAFDDLKYVTFRNVLVHGTPVAGDPTNAGTGFSFFDSSYITVDSSTFHDLALRAIAMSTRNGTANLPIGNVVSNDVCYMMGEDCFDFAQQQGVQIFGNVMYNFFVSIGSHPDAIQFSTSNTLAPSNGAQIFDNLICKGTGNDSQAIFGRDDSAGQNIKATNFNIHDNTIIGTGFSGLRPADEVNITVSHNTLVTLVGGNATNYLVELAVGLTSTGNTASSISILGNGNTGVTSTGDVITAAVSDGGAAAIATWKAAHPGKAACPASP